MSRKKLDQLDDLCLVSCWTLQKSKHPWKQLTTRKNSKIAGHLLCTMTSFFITMTNNWTPTRHSGIAVDTLDFFQNLLRKSTKIRQCIQTNEVSRNLSSNFSEVSYFLFKLLLQKRSSSKTNKGQADQFPYATPSW